MLFIRHTGLPLQLVNIPEWVNTVHYDVLAKAPGEPSRSNAAFPTCELPSDQFKQTDRTLLMNAKGAVSIWRGVHVAGSVQTSH